MYINTILTKIQHGTIKIMIKYMVIGDPISHESAHSEIADQDQKADGKRCPDQNLVTYKTLSCILLFCL